MTGIIQHTGETKIQILRLIVIRDNRRDIIQNTAIISAVRIMLLLVIGIVIATAMSVMVFINRKSKTCHIIMMVMWYHDMHQQYKAGERHQEYGDCISHY